MIRIHDDERLVFLELQQEIDNKILKDNEVAVKKFKKSPHSDERVEKAQKQEAKSQKNKIYDEKIIPYTNAIIYFMFYVAAFISLVFVHYGNDKAAALLFLTMLIMMLFVFKYVESNVRSDITKDFPIMKIFVHFADKTSSFSFIITAIGYFAAMQSAFEFWFVYLVMLAVSLIALYFDLLAPLLKHNHSKC